MRSSGVRGWLIRTLAANIVLIAAGSCLRAEDDAPLVRVCDVLQNLNAYKGKTVAVVGRYSFRRNGRFFSESACDHDLKTGDVKWPKSLRIVFDQSAPKPAQQFEIDAPAAYRVLKIVQQRTQPAKFPFGTSDYDRWAVAYGRVEPTKQFEAGSPPGSAPTALEPAPATLLCVGDAVITFLVEREEDSRPAQTASSSWR